MVDKMRVDNKGKHMARSISFIVLAFFLGSFLSADIPAQQETPPLQVNDYRIGPKDLLEITVFELPELNQTVRVSEDGSITLSLLGRVEVAGLTAQELERKLASLLDKQYTKGAHVTVFIREYQKVSVNGAVGRPGMYELVGPTTLLQIIAQAGGLTAQAMTELFVFRQGEDDKQTKITIRLGDLMTSGNPELNIEVRPKDVITIPIDQMQNVFLYGEVRNPGAIPYLSSKKITLLQAIAQAGGTTEWAKKSRVMIKRKDNKTGKEMKINVNLKNMINGKIADIVLEEGDVVIVP
ncbi:MAG: polysaccharide biosynthesis/export family protein [Acidobacteria bacterium]|nr:polysaccharide biosynthesis/export family protein [Acidobacteriota bacterium]